MLWGGPDTDYWTLREASYLKFGDRGLGTLQPSAKTRPTSYLYAITSISILLNDHHKYLLKPLAHEEFLVS